MLFDGRDLRVVPAQRASSEDRRRSLGWIAGFFVGMLALAAFLAPNPFSRGVSDQVSTLLNPPSTAVRILASDAAMTDAGTALFFAATPTLETRPDLAESCRDPSLDVLGCYDSADGSIHLLATDDPRTVGMSAGIAAHEMLHVAWDRLSDVDRARLSPLLLTAWDELSLDPVFAERMSSYSDLDAEGFIVELHSVLGTEAGRLSSELESHFALYLADRGGLASRTALAMAATGD